MGALDGTAWITHHAEVEHPAASTLKLPLLVAVRRAAERGALDLDTEIEVHDTFDSAVDGERYITTQDYDNDDEPWGLLGQRASIDWLVRRAIIRSSNLATNLLIEHVGCDAVNEVYEIAGASRSRLRRGIQDGPAGDHGLWNTASAADMAAVLLATLDGTLLTEESAAEVEAILAACENNDAIPAGLPHGVAIAHKPGWIDAACHDVAIVRPADEAPFVLAIYTAADLDDPSIHRLAADAARICWELPSTLNL